MLKGQYKFQKAVYIGKKEGLPNTLISAIGKDEDGFMWFGTQTGLCRFDGTYTEVFQPDKDLLFPAVDFSIHCMHIEGDTIWIGHDNGFLLFNRATEKFEDFPFEYPDSNRTFYHVYAIHKEKSGDIWLGIRRRGIFRLKPTSGEFTIFNVEADSLMDKAILSGTKDIYSIIQDNHYNTILWAASRTGLLRLNKETGRVNWFYKTFENKTKEAQFNQFLELHQYPNGKIYLGTYFNGVNVFDPVTETFSELPLTGNHPNESILNTRIHHISRFDEDHLWISAHDGLLLYNIKTQQLEKVFVNGKSEFGGTNRYGITYIDELNRIWYTYDTGIFLYDPLLQQFDYTRFRNIPEKRGAIPRQISEDEKTGDLLLIGQYTEGLMNLNRSSGEWSLIPPPAGFLNQAPYFHGWSFVPYSDNSILILEEDHGLLTYKPGQNTLKWHSIQPELAFYENKPLIRDHLGYIWIGTHLNGLIRFDPSNQQFTYIKEELEHPELDAFANTIWYLFIDSRQNLWIRRDQGYSVYLHKKDTFLNFLYPVDSRYPKHIENFAEDRNGRIWMPGGGEPFLYYADVKHPEKGTQGKVRLFSETEDKLYVMYAEADNSGNIWVTTSYGLARLDPDDFSIQKFGYDYGMHSFSRYLKRLSSGEMVVGHRDAISFFYPDSIKINLERPKPYITRFKIFDEDLQTDSSLVAQKRVKLSYKQNFFSIEYAAIAYTVPSKINYKYKLEGFEDNWNDAGKRRYAAYTNVPAGNYTFLLKATNSEGLESTEPFQLAIQIIPPWWHTNWAISMFAVAFIGLVYFFYQLHLNQQLKQAENHRLKELDAVKTRLYTNITHEFRTPLTIIKGMMQKIQENPKRWLEEGGLMIARNTESLLQLVNQMLALRKLESGVMKVNYVQDDIVPYLKYLFESFRSLAESKGVEFQIDSEVDELYMDYDPEKLQMIVSNLLSNAIKFTPTGGRVKIRFNNTLGVFKTPRVLLNLILTDTGVGIPPDKLPFIFDRFYQVDDSATRRGEGIGVGLALTKELVQLLDGEIQVASQPGQGTTFSILFPIHQTAEKVDSSEVIPVVSQPSSHLSASKPSIISPGLTDQPSILIIEDNPDMVAYIKSCLEKSYELSVASNGKEGIKKAFEIVPDLIISDVMMPGKDGFEVCKEVKTDERTSHVPIILLTAKADMDSKIQGLERGADAYLVKPFQPEELEVRLKKLLELRAHLKEKYANSDGFLLEKIAPTDPEARFLNRVKEAILSNLDDEDFGVNELAESLALSRMQVHRKLKALVGQPPSDYLRTIRLHQARHWLRHTDWTISEIAYRTGFRDQSYFTKVYKDYFDTIPSKDR